MDFTQRQVLDECLEWIKGVTLEAGKIVKEGFQCKSLNVETKDGIYDVVTVYDQRTEDFLFGQIQAKYPEHKLIGEETNAKTKEELVLTEEPTWIIDPIDGTMNFVRRIPLIAIGLALVYRKKVVLAVAYNPITEELFTATLGGGAHLNGERIHCSQHRLLSEAMVMDEISIAFRPENTSRLLGRTFKTVNHVFGMRSLGSAVLNFAYVAAGRIDAYQCELLKPWDVAGGTLLVTEAGGVLKDSYTGGEFDILKPNVLVASTPELLEAMWTISQEVEGKTLRLE